MTDFTDRDLLVEALTKMKNIESSMKTSDVDRKELFDKFTELNTFVRTDLRTISEGITSFNKHIDPRRHKEISIEDIKSFHDSEKGTEYLNRKINKSLENLEVRIYRQGRKNLGSILFVMLAAFVVGYIKFVYFK